MKRLIIIIFLSIFFYLFPLAIIWSQKHLVIGLNLFIGSIIFILILLLATGLILWIKNFIGKHISITPDMLFTGALISYLSLLLLFPLSNINSTLDIHLHDTYYLISYSYPIMLVVLIFAIFAAIYHWFERIFKRKMNRWLGSAHFWITYLGLNILQISIQQIQFSTNPRRYIDYSSPDAINYLNIQNSFISTFILIIIGAQLLFLYNFCYSLTSNKNKNLTTYESLYYRKMELYYKFYFSHYRGILKDHALRGG
ncbi:cbb3-type cytochrome c oxidase subunit I [Flavihumibacter cheonanensis]|uniref:cbb3-type cytochrome c oxidase subunit I n=1 Tax=Flavihumibacter cheonanensis TaxID=1442385 RepID=UPI0034DB4C8B